MARKVFTATEVHVLKRNTAIEKLDQETAAELQMQARQGRIAPHITVLTNDHVLPSGEAPTKLLEPGQSKATGMAAKEHGGGNEGGSDGTSGS
jgi:hypothetical protein